jgi:hypothetical protein
MVEAFGAAAAAWWFGLLILDHALWQAHCAALAWRSRDADCAEPE